MKRRRDIRAARRDHRRPRTLQHPDQERQADLDSAFSERDRERAIQIKRTLK